MASIDKRGSKALVVRCGSGLHPENCRMETLLSGTGGYMAMSETIDDHGPGAPGPMALTLNQ